MLKKTAIFTAIAIVLALSLSPVVAIDPEREPVISQPQETGKTIAVSTNSIQLAAIVRQTAGDQFIVGLKKSNFAVFVDGVRKEVTSFATPETPISVVLLVEYSSLTTAVGPSGRGSREPGAYAVIRPAAMFLSKLIKPPDDYAAVMAFDLRPTRMTDFTNDSARLNEAIDLLLRNRPAFRESNVFDSLTYALVGGPGDASVLPDSKSARSDFAGLVSLQGRRKAVVLITSGWDTFSKIKYGQVRKIVQDAGVPIYIVGTMGLLRKQLGYSDQIDLGQAERQLKTFALETGGAYYPYAAEDDVPRIFQNISAMLRSQYSLAFEPDGLHDGKAHKIGVKVDVDGDGVYDDKLYVVQARQVFNAPKK